MKTMINWRQSGMRIQRNTRYIGCFVDRNALTEAMMNAGITRDRLPIIIDYPHVTFEYMPQDYKEELFGCHMDIEVFAYGNNGMNEGLAVHICSDNPQIIMLAKKIECPHITVSRAFEAKCKDTRYLDFEPLEHTFFLHGIFGGFDVDSGVPVFR